MSQLSRRASTLSNRPPLSELKTANQDLNPVLKAVLDSLDVDLDTELTRYRRHILLQQRAARQSPDQASTLTVTSPFSFEGLDDTVPPALPASIHDLTSGLTDSEALSGIDSGTEPGTEPGTESIPELGTELSPNALPAENHILAPASDGRLDSLSDQAVEERSESHAVEVESVTASALATIAVEVEEEQGQLSNVAADDLSAALPANPDDYLESSEELLRSLEDEEKRAEAIAAESVSSASKSSLVDSIFTPLGVGSILLLILSSATLGYLVIRPSTLNMLASWANGKTASVPGLQAQPEGGLSNLSPDLAAGEFDPLKASNLSSLPGAVSPSAIGAETTADGTDDSEGDPSDPEATEGTREATVASTGAPTSAINSSVNSRIPGGAAPTPPARVVGPSLATSLPTAPPQLAPPRPAATPSPRSSSPAPRLSVPTPRRNAPAPRPTVSAPVTARPFAPRSASPAPSPTPVIRNTPAPTNSASSPAPSSTPAPTRRTSSSPSRQRPPVPDPIGPEPIVTPIEEQIGPAPARSSAPAPSTAAPAPAPASVPIPVQSPPQVTATPAPAPAPTPAPAPAPAPAASTNSDMYYVTTPYTGDRSLDSARDAVSGSHVRNFPQGTQVQMGAFSNEAGAEAMVENLQNQGISAEVQTGE